MPTTPTIPTMTPRLNETAPSSPLEISLTAHDIIKKFSEATMMKLPFGEDYRHVNSLRYFSQEQNRLKKEKSAVGHSTLSAEVVLEIISSFNTYNDTHEELLQSANNDDDTDEELQTALESIKKEFSQQCESFKISVDEAIKIAETKNELEKQLAHVDDRLANDIAKFFQEIFTNAQNNFSKKHTAWQKAIYADYIAQEKHRPSADHFIAYIQTISKHYLPEEYAATLGELFPSGSKNKHPSGFAHYHYNNRLKIHGLLASSAPKKSGALSSTQQATDDHETEQAFLSMLFNSNVAHILVLGCKSSRIDYKSVSVGQYQSTFDEDTNIITITDTAKTAEIDFIEIQLSYVPVKDQEPLNLSNEQLTEFLMLYKHYQNGMILIHCDSGVGRTGQAALLLTSLNAIDQNEKTPSTEKINLSALETFIVDLINDDEEDVVELSELIEHLSNHMIHSLNQLRKTRYAIETEAQFSSSCEQLLLLIAARMQCTPDQLNKVRKKLEIIETMPHAMIGFNNEDEFIPISSPADSSRHSLKSESSVHSESPLLRPIRSAERMETSESDSTKDGCTKSPMETKPSLKKPHPPSSNNQCGWHFTRKPREETTQSPTPSEREQKPT